jgi:hypothetical protein
MAAALQVYSKDWDSVIGMAGVRGTVTQQEVQAKQSVDARGGAGGKHAGRSSFFVTLRLAPFHQEKMLFLTRRS